MDRFADGVFGKLGYGALRGTESFGLVEGGIASGGQGMEIYAAT